MLAIRMLLRSWRDEEVRLVIAALVLAVAVVTSVTLLADRVERALIAESSSFLAADLVLESHVPIDSELINEAQGMGLRTATTLSFVSMVYNGDRMHLASIKAVDDGYPLRGQVRHADRAFSDDPAHIKSTNAGPEPGVAWVESRLLPLLNVELGNTIEFGESRLNVNRILIEAPDTGTSFSFLGARILLHADDLPAAGVLVPGSRVKYRLLLAADGKQGAQTLAEYRASVQSRISLHQRWISPEDAQQSIADTMQKARRFLLLSGSIGVILASIALALASHSFALGEIRQVGLYKTWGLSAPKIRRIYCLYALAIGVVGSLLGILLGAFMHEILLFVVQDWLPSQLPEAGFKPWIIGIATGIICLAGFMLPSIWHLPALPAMTVLRKDIPIEPVSTVKKSAIGLLAIAGLLLWYSENALLMTAMLAGFLSTALAAVVVGYGLLLGVRWLSQHLTSVWRLALANLWRRRLQSLIQVLGFSGAIALLMIMWVLKTSLIDEWRWQLADDAPNHFLVNVAPNEVVGVDEAMAKRALDSSGWYSMVRGRILQFNEVDLTPEQRDGHESLRREINLSWSKELPKGNSLMSGDWWPALPEELRSQNADITPVSIEVELARELGLALGDRITFSIGGLEFEAELTSTRQLDWKEMRPSFYFLFPEGRLEKFPRTFMTSVYIPSADKLLLNDLLRQYPTLQVIALDKVIARVRTIITQVTRGLEVMTLMILACGILVMFAAVRLSMSERLHESAVLRTLGSSRGLILGVQLIEFTSLGMGAGFLSALGAETALVVIQYYLFDLTPVWHLWLWVVGPLGAGLLVGILGVAYSRSAVKQSPLALLRRL